MTFRIGVVSQHHPGWAGGTTYTRALVASLMLAGVREDDVVVFADGELAPGTAGRCRVAQLRTDAAARGVVGRLRAGAMRRFATSELFRVAERERVSVLVPLQRFPSHSLTLPVIGWIPDFQHKHLPEYFSAAEFRARDVSFSEIADRSALVMLSSEAARRDYESCFPAAASKARVWRFPSLFTLEPPSDAPPEVLERLGLPGKFALVVNQFWAHKNHECVVRAVALARERGVDVPTVFVGLPADYRDPTNAAVSRTLRAVAEARVRDLCHVIGEVSRAELVSLLRTAAVVVQPSRAEGWNTTVQDARALGIPVICSDLPVLREQAEDALGFFGADEPEELAAILARAWASLPAGFQRKRESHAVLDARGRAATEAARLLRICCEAAGVEQRCI